MDQPPLDRQRVSNKSRARRRWVLLVGFLIASELVLAWAFQRPQSVASQIAKSPLAGLNCITIVDHGTDPTAQPVRYEVRDGQSLFPCQSMFVPIAEHRCDMVMPIATQYSIGDVPPGLHGSMNTIKVWHANGGLVWSQGNGVYKVDGDLAAFLTTVEARRVVQLILSKDDQERTKGLRLKQLEGDKLIDAFLSLCPSQNQQLRAFALRNLALLVAESHPGWVAPWQLQHDPRRAAAVTKAEDVRRVTLQVLKTALADQAADASIRHYETISCACDCLAETGNQTTANELAALLGDDARKIGWDPMMDCLETIYGLPPTYEKNAMCGNSSAAERAAFAKQEAIRRRAARDKLLQWHADHGGENRTVQLEAILDEWQTRLLALGEHYKMHEAYELAPNKRFLPLLRIGLEMVPLLEQRKQQSIDIVERGALELVKTIITGKCDDALVNELLNGEILQQILACKIIGAAGRTDWQSQLDAFQYVPLPINAPERFYDVWALRSAATAALLISHDPQAFELVKAAHAAKFANPQSDLALKFYTPPEVK